MKRNNISPDLHSYATRALLRRVIPFCILEALMIALFVILGNDLFGKEIHPAFRILIYAILVLIPFLVTKFPWNLRDRTLRGTVLEVSTERNLAIIYCGTRTITRGGRMSFKASGQSGGIMRVTVRLENGNTICQRLPFPRHPNHPPAEGAEVFHLYGSEHIITLPTPADDHVHCAVCNEINDLKAKTCRACGHTLVK